MVFPDRCWRRKALAPSPRRSGRLLNFITPKNITSSTSARTPAGTAAWEGRGFPAPWASGNSLFLLHHLLFIAGKKRPGTPVDIHAASMDKDLGTCWGGFPESWVFCLLTSNAKVEAGTAPITSSCSVQLLGFPCHLKRWKGTQTSEVWLKMLLKGWIRRWLHPQLLCISNAFGLFDFLGLINFLCSESFDFWRCGLVPYLSQCWDLMSLGIMNWSDQWFSHHNSIFTAFSTTCSAYFLKLL